MTFDLHSIFNGVLMIYDRETESIWSIVDGECVDGTYKGATLKNVQLLSTTWKQWKELHPDTVVLSDNTPFKHAYQRHRLGAPDYPQGFLETITHKDDRLRENELVLALKVGKKFKAYPLEELKKAGGVVNDELEGTPFVVVFDPQSRAATAYLRRVDEQVLDFKNGAAPAFPLKWLYVSVSPLALVVLPTQAENEMNQLRLVDAQTGSAWNIAGKAVEGPLCGKGLTFLPSAHITEWYGWVAFHPQTEVFRAEATRKSVER